MKIIRDFWFVYLSTTGPLMRQKEECANSSDITKLREGVMQWRDR